jgi:hypothetical protein
MDVILNQAQLKTLVLQRTRIGKIGVKNIIDQAR